MLIVNMKPVLLQVIYHMPAHPSLVQEFTWGYEDRIPELLRTHRFLEHWRRNIDAIISEVLISIDDGRHRNWRSVDALLNLN